ncbi:helix-turn-helix domain-containing protein [Pedobacter rhodius]|uniref:Helix-turn-helix domain-containing protein n=1 Tax=Pedobacter rhodius TaxID=3004098 RepID=A0ABT4KVH7_9SPHI|nr:helix-turn-helix domain-containing protein [Pedobacter sp. SJ11]MCZ4222926.1 helix-turn-helix domain-containing protein [Pedobacter sp. SJ11]
MFFDFSFKSSVLFVFFFHGFVFSILLLIKGLQSGNKSSIWLSAAVFLSVLYILPFMCGYGGWYARLPYRDVLYYVPFQQLFLIPPVLYIYTKSLLDKSFVLTPKEYIHFIPAAIYLVYSFIIFYTDKIIIKDYYYYQDGKDKDFSAWYQISGFISLFYYLLLSLKVYNKYKSLSYQMVSFADAIRFNWIKRFLFAFLLLLGLRALFFILNPEWDKFGSKFWYYLCVAVLFYYISISGYVTHLKSVIPLNTASIFLQDDADKNEVPTEDINKNQEPETVDLELKDFQQLKVQIEQVMTTDKVFKNPELTLLDVSHRINVTTKRVSQVINQGFGMNFNDFVNHYRTLEVIELLHTDRLVHFTLLGIALECGFNSKSTFNRAFKKQTRLTPKAYLEKINLKNGAKS